MPLNSRDFIKFCVTSASKLASHDSSGTVKTSYSLPDVTTQEQETKSKTGSSSSGFNIIHIYVYAHKIFLNCEICHTYRVLHKACMYSSKNTYKVNTHVISTHIKIQNVSSPQLHCVLFSDHNSILSLQVIIIFILLISLNFTTYTWIF